MLFAYLLASTLAMSAVLGRSSGPAPRYVTYETEKKTIGQSDTTAQIMDVSDRSSNLKYVMAIQSSSIWAEIKERSLTLHSPQKLDGTVDEDSLNDLTDQELAQLKQACHDGLKCVAVDQLMVLKEVKEPLAGGKVSVRRAITKITEVITKYTTEYHEDVYEYEMVQESDDQSKMYESVTTIMEDNKELCRIDFKPETEDSPLKNVDDNTVPAADKNNNTINFNTTNNYNINKGTINSVNVNIKPDSEAATDEPAKIESKNRSPNHHDLNADNQSLPPATANSTPVRQKPTTADYPEYVQYTGESTPVDQPLMITNRPSSRDGSSTAANNSREGRNSQRPRPNATRRTTSAHTDEPASNNEIVLKRGNGNRATVHAEKAANDRASNNTIGMENSSGGNLGGENDCDTDIVSAGSYNKNLTRKGMVEDGILNNGNMTAKTADNSNRNKGTIKGATADKGIISVGTINNGPTNYGKFNKYTNNGNTSNMGNFDLLNYVDNIDKMYSTILNEFAKD